MDDNLLFCRVTVEECQNLLTLLEKYEAALGQAINRQKTSLFFSKNTRQDVRNTIQQMLGARVMHDCERYLGLPMTCGWSKVNTFKEIQEKISKHVMGWKEKFISKTGCEVLIKTVVQAIPTYFMSVFRLPKSICDGINSLLEKYWWEQDHEEWKIHWINWTKLYSHKRDGGMGFRDLNAFNLAMLAKQAWRLIQNIHSLFHIVYKARYFSRSTFLKVELGRNPSFVWRSLLEARDIIMEGSRWQVGDGRTIEVATHVWLPHTPIFLQEPTLNMRVCELIDEDTRQWDRGKVLATFAQKT